MRSGRSVIDSRRCSWSVGSCEVLKFGEDFFYAKKLLEEHHVVDERKIQVY